MGRKLTLVQRRVLSAIDRYGYDGLRRMRYNSRWAIYHKLGKRGYIRHARVVTPAPDGNSYVTWGPVLTDKGRKALEVAE